MRAGVGIVAAMAVVSACAGGVTGVQSKSLTTDVDFGLPPSASPTPFVTASAVPAAPAAAPASPAAAATTPPAALLPAPSMVVQPVAAAPVTQAAAAPTVPLNKPSPSASYAAPIVGTGPPVLSAAQPKCPVAPYGSSAALLTIDVTKVPAVGSYREVYTSSQTVGSNTVNTTSYLTMDVTKVSTVSSLPNPLGGNTTTFTFDTVLHLANGVLETTTWQVKNNSPVKNETAGNVGGAVAVGEPDRGIAMESVLVTDKTGATVESSTYAPGVLEQPLPVDVGQTFTGEGANASGGVNTGTLVFDGRELDVKHLDACGTLVDAYEDTGNQVIVNGSTQSSTPLDVAFATNLGGLPVYMQGIDATTGDLVTLQLGQGTPSPLGTDRS